MSDLQTAKRAAAHAAADLVPNGAKLGLGSGSTFLLVLEEIGRASCRERV